jgi:hypothetical protein
MVEERIKAALVVAAAAGASFTCLTLPTIRNAVAVLPEPRSTSVWCSGLREIARRSHVQFGDIAAEVAGTYLRRLGASRCAVPTVEEKPRSESRF